MLDCVLRAVTCVLVITLSLSGAAGAGVIATNDDIVNGKKNLADPAFLEADIGADGMANAVRSLLTDNPDAAREAKTAIIRSIISAVEALPDARGRLSDVSAQRLFSSLLAYDLTSGKAQFNDIEISTLRDNYRLVLEHYTNPDGFAWDDDRFALGAGALRLAAAEALFSFNFPDDYDADRMRVHGLQYLKKNLAESISGTGAWLPEPPGIADDAILYMTVAGKVFKNTGMYNVFADSSFIDLLQWSIQLMPPPSSSAAAGFIMPSVGDTDIGVSHAAVTMISAGEVARYSPDTASMLAWYWFRSERPVTPLGMLFIDTSIQPTEPVRRSRYAGAGIALLRDNVGKTVESGVAVTFGNPNGGIDRDGLTHPDNGDFSFIWKGIPLVLHDGAGHDPCTTSFVDRMPWRHSLVLKNGAGDSPVLISDDSGGQVKRDVLGRSTPPADFYTDGIRQFLSTPAVDYVSGDTGGCVSASENASHVRHFLFLKPDALLVWDQLQSSAPLEWNLWASCENAWAENNTLHLHTGRTVDLQVHFAGDTAVDFIQDPIPSEVSWDWPVVMRAAHGRGMITLLSADILAEAASDTTELAMRFLENAVSRNGKPSLVGLITINTRISDMLSALGIKSEILSYETVGGADFTRFNSIVIDGRMTARQQRILMDYGWKINEFIEVGGDVLVTASPGLPWLTGGDNTDTIPVPVTLGECMLSAETDSLDLMLHGSDLWAAPNPIALNDWSYYTTPPDSGGMTPPPVAKAIPVSWSDRWDVLASIPKSFPIGQPERDPMPRRIRVGHPASRDFFTLFLPRTIGDQTYRFDIDRIERGMITFADPTTKWEIKAGESAWTDANLSVKIDSLGVRKLYAFDCTYVRIGDEIIQAEMPLSIYYDQQNDSGIIMTAENNIVSCSRHELKPYAGTISFSNLFGDIRIRRSNYVSLLTVRDRTGMPVNGARVTGDSGLIGTTDMLGTLCVPWTSNPPTLRVSRHDMETLVNLVPGTVEVMLGE